MKITSQNIVAVVFSETENNDEKKIFQNGLYQIRLIEQPFPSMRRCEILSSNRFNSNHRIHHVSTLPSRRMMTKWSFSLKRVPFGTRKHPPRVRNTSKQSNYLFKSSCALFNAASLFILRNISKTNRPPARKELSLRLQKLPQQWHHRDSQNLVLLFQMLLANCWDQP